MLKSILLLLFLILSFYYTFSLCTPQVTLGYEVADKVGKYYRRVDVTLYTNIKVKGKRVEKVNVRIRVAKGSSTTIEIKPEESVEGDFLLVIPVENQIPEFAVVEEMYENVEETYTAYPADLSKNFVKFPLPHFKKGKIIRVILQTENIGKPYLEKVYIEVPKEPLKITYSVYFGYARVRTEDRNLEHLRILVSKLKNSGLLKKVEIVGFADANSKNLQKNLNVAKKRALFVFESLLGKEALKCINQGALR